MIFWMDSLMDRMGYIIVLPINIAFVTELLCLNKALMCGTENYERKVNVVMGTD